MVTRYLRYVIDPYGQKELEHYAWLRIPLGEKFGGRHHGCFLPSEGANNIAYALLSFPSPSEDEHYGIKSMQDPECLAAFRYAEETRCIVNYERSLLRPVLS